VPASIKVILMDDLALTRACAEAMGYTNISDHWGGLPMSTKETGPWNPIYDDAQAKALVKKFKLDIVEGAEGGWDVSCFVGDTTKVVQSNDSNLNRAICKCVANITDLLEAG